MKSLEYMWSKSDIVLAMPVPNHQVIDCFILFACFMSFRCIMLFRAFVSFRYLVIVFLNFAALNAA